jgi:hypothetical protein
VTVHFPNQDPTVRENDDTHVQMVLEMLSHRTPPSCIPPVILTIVESLYNDPMVNVVRQLLSVQTVWEWRFVLVVVTKTLAAYLLGRADSYKQLFTDGTSRRQTAIQNTVVGVLMDGGFKMVSLSSGILAENETAECLTGSIICTLKEGDQLLDDWRIVLERLYPSRQNLLNVIPQSQALTLAKLANDGMVSTDTCCWKKRYLQAPPCDLDWSGTLTSFRNTPL